MKQNAFIEKIADKINDLGLIAPATLLLEANKPLAFIGSQLLLIAQPTLNMFLPRNLTQNSIDLLANPDQLEQLIVTLETKTFQGSVPHTSAKIERVAQRNPPDTACQMKEGE